MSTDNAVEQAIDWLVLMQSGDFDAAQQRQLHAWRAADVRHEQVFSRLQEGLAPLAAQPLRELPGVLEIVQAPSSRRRFVRNGLALLGLGAGAVLLERVANVGLALPGELYTGIGERRTWLLDDGSQLVLNARSIASLDTHQPRHQTLKQGELLVRVQQGNPPFVLQTQGATLRLDQGQYLLRQEGERLRLVTFEHGARLQGSTRLDQNIAARRSLLFDRQRVYDDSPAAGFDAAWQEGWMVLRNQPLARLIEALRPYQHGLLRISDAAASLNVSGRFPLDDVPRCLDLIAGSLPITIRRLPFMASIDRVGV